MPKFVTIGGSTIGAIEIIGNKKKNYISSGHEDSILNDGKRKDTLLGGNDFDTLRGKILNSSEGGIFYLEIAI